MQVAWQQLVVDQEGQRHGEQQVGDGQVELEDLVCFQLVFGLKCQSDDYYDVPHEAQDADDGVDVGAEQPVFTLLLLLKLQGSGSSSLSEALKPAWMKDEASMFHCR